MAQIVTGSIAEHLTEFHKVIIEEHFNIFNSYVKLTIRKRKSGFFESATVYERKIRIPIILLNDAKSTFYWAEANKNIRVLAASVLQKLENKTKET